MPIRVAQGSTAVKGIVPSAETPSSGFDQIGRSARRADALVAIAETMLAAGPRSRTGGDRHQIVVHVDRATLENDRAGVCELDDGSPLEPETARRLACDSGVVGLLKDGAAPVTVGRRTRSIPPSLRRALQARDRGCRFPGCTQQRFVDGHHVRHWANGGETSLANLIQLCRFHHRLVHEGGYSVRVDGDGAPAFRRPDRRLIPEAPVILPPAGVDLADVHRHLGLAIDRGTARSLWSGEKMNYALAVELLLDGDGLREWPSRPELAAQHPASGSGPGRTTCAAQAISSPA